MIGQAEVAFLLGVTESCVPILLRARLLRALETVDRAGPNTVKHFASVEIESLAKDREFLSRARLAIAKYWERKNASRQDGREIC